MSIDLPLMSITFTVVVRYSLARISFNQMDQTLLLLLLFATARSVVKSVKVPVVEVV